MTGIRKELLIILRYKSSILAILFKKSDLPKVLSIKYISTIKNFQDQKPFQEDEMPNRLGLLHVRPCGEKQATEDEDVDKVVEKIVSY